MVPTYLTRFVGREATLTDLEARLVNGRLLTLTGPGGVGKTRLAAELAARMREKERQPIYWVDVAPLVEGDLLAPAVATTVGLRLQSGQRVTQALTQYLADEACLVLLDNCEHLVAACAELVTTLLHHCPSVQVVATSRQPLGIAGELRYLVPPLSLPQEGEPATSEAVALFVDRAMTVLPHFQLADQVAPAIAHICRHLDGLPLAIELAAARVNILTIPQISEQLDNRFGLLQSQTPAAIPARHHTLQAAIAGSYELLSPQAQILLRRLAVFDNGCTLEMAEAVCTDSLLPTRAILECLNELVNHSLLMAETVAHHEARYRLLETIRVYVREKLLNTTVEEPLHRDKHLAYFVEKVETIEPKLYDVSQRRWFDWLDRELNNMRRALRWALATDPAGNQANGRRTILGARLALALGQYWIQRHFLVEGQRWLEAFATAPDEDVPLALRARTAVFATFCAGLRFDADGTRRMGQMAVSLAEASEDPFLRCLAYGAYSLYFNAVGENGRAYQLVKQSLALARQINDPFNIGMGLCNLAIQATSLARFDEAQMLLDESLANAREAGDPFRIGQSLLVLGDLQRVQRRWASARLAYEEAIDTFMQVGDVSNAATARHNLAHVFLQEAQLTNAHALLEAATQMQQAQGNRRGMVEMLPGYGALALTLGDAETAVILLTAFSTQINQPVVSLYSATQQAYRATLEAAQSQLNASKLAAAQRRGQQLSLRDAMDLARSLTLPSPSEDDGLSPRQREVVALISAGKSNGEIAETLVLSKRTVEKHVANILAKLTLNNRAEIVRWGIERKLIP
jgi:predicted ATPase/DNA-binding NarL/FixJ family response regulator